MINTMPNKMGGIYMSQIIEVVTTWGIGFAIPFFLMLVVLLNREVNKSA